MVLITIWKPVMSQIKKGVPSVKVLGAVAFAGVVLDRLDPPRRIIEVLPLAAVLGSAATPWRTRAEHQASPNQASINPFQPSDPVVELPDRLIHRSTIYSEARRIAADLTELLRRQLRS